MPPLSRCISVVVLCILLAPVSALAGGPIASGSIVNGTLSGPSYSESWTFSGTVGDRIVIAAVTTSGAVNTNILLHPPFGPGEYTTANDRFDLALSTTPEPTNESRGPGLHSETWDGRDNTGARVASGVYYVQFEAGGKALRQKVVLVR